MSRILDYVRARPGLLQCLHGESYGASLDGLDARLVHLVAARRGLLESIFEWENSDEDFEGAKMAGQFGAHFFDMIEKRVNLEAGYKDYDGDSAYEAFEPICHHSCIMLCEAHRAGVALPERANAFVALHKVTHTVYDGRSWCLEDCGTKSKPGERRHHCWTESDSGPDISHDDFATLAVILRDWDLRAVVLGNVAAAAIGVAAIA